MMVRKICSHWFHPCTERANRRLVTACVVEFADHCCHQHAADELTLIPGMSEQRTLWKPADVSVNVRSAPEPVVPSLSERNVRQPWTVTCSRSDRHCSCDHCSQRTWLPQNTTHRTRYASQFCLCVQAQVRPAFAYSRTSILPVTAAKTRAVRRS